MKIAGLLTCFNRASKTEACLKRIKDILDSNKDIELYLFITNDGSTDKTQEMLKAYQQVLNITIIQGNGNLFWSGGMRAAWNMALETGGFEGYLWINDDTYLTDNVFLEIVSSQEFSKSNFKQECISVGATCSLKTQKLTYSGMKNGKRLKPTDEFQLCDMSNGNIVYVPNSIVSKIGIIDKHYHHGIGDIDYTYSAYKKGIPVLLLRGYCGICDNDHSSKYSVLCKKTIFGRYKFVMSPLGFQMKDYLYYQYKFWPYKIPLVLMAIVSKVFFPKVEMKIRGIKF